MLAVARSKHGDLVAAVRQTLGDHPRHVDTPMIHAECNLHAFISSLSRRGIISRKSCASAS